MEESPTRIGNKTKFLDLKRSQIKSLSRAKSENQHVRITAKKKIEGEEKVVAIKKLIQRKTRRRVKSRGGNQMTKLLKNIKKEPDTELRKLMTKKVHKIRVKNIPKSIKNAKNQKNFNLQKKSMLQSSIKKIKGLSYHERLKSSFI